MVFYVVERSLDEATRNRGFIMGFIMYDGLIILDYASLHRGYIFRLTFNI